MSGPTKEEVVKSIEPDSTQINAEDAIGGPLTVTVDRVSRGSKEQPINIHLAGYDRVYRPCKTCRRILIAIWSDDAATWRGQQMTLFCDPDIKYGGLKVGGLRISHASGLKEPRTFLLTKSRGHKAEVTIHPIVVLSPSDQTYIAESTKTLTKSATLEELEGHGQILKSKSKAIQDALRPIYITRKAELKQTGRNTVPE